MTSCFPILLTLILLTPVSHGRAEGFDPLDRRLIELDLPTSCYTPLKRAGILTLRKLLECSQLQLLEINGISDQIFASLSVWVTSQGYTIGVLSAASMAVKEKPVESLDLPLRLSSHLAIKGVKKIGQLVLLTETEMLNYLRTQENVELIRRALAKYGLELGETELGEYDLPLGAVFTFHISRKFKHVGLTTLKEITLLSNGEYLSLEPLFMSDASRARVDSLLKRLGLKLGESPFLDLSLSERVVLFRAGIETESDLGNTPVSEVLFQLRRSAKQPQKPPRCRRLFLPN